MLKVLLDTSFILPTLGVDTGPETLHALEKLDKAKAQLYYSAFTLLESLWIIARLARSTPPSLETVEAGLRSITRSGKYVSITEPPEAYAEALTLYLAGHKDVIDNILYANSTYYQLKLLTLDQELQSFVKRKRLKNTLIHPKDL